MGHNQKIESKPLYPGFVYYLPHVNQCGKSANNVSPYPDTTTHTSHSIQPTTSTTGYCTQK